MRISVVIPFFNGDDIIKQCIKSVLNGHLKPDKIYIINNSSIQTNIHTFFYTEPSVEVIDCKPSIGFGRASNIGAYHAINNGCDIVIILNQDTVVYHDSFQELINPLTQENTISISVPLICCYENDKFLEKIYIQMYISPLYDMISDALTGSGLKSFYEIDHAISGACMAIKCSAICEIGLFEPTIWMYGEDVDLFVRYKSHGKIAVIVSSSRVSHAHSHAGAEGKNLYTIKSNIHKNAPYSIWNNKSLVIKQKVKKILIFLLTDYLSAINKFRWNFILGFILLDLTLVFRLFKIGRHQNLAILKTDIEKKIIEDQKRE